MDTEQKLVTLIGPAKVDRTLRKAGSIVLVTADQLAQLVDAGAAPAEALSLFDFDGSLASDFDAALAAAIADREANWSTAMDHFETMAEDRQSAAIAELKEAHAAEINQVERRKYAAADQALVDELTGARAQVTDLQSQLAAANEKLAAKKTTTK